MKPVNGHRPKPLLSQRLEGLLEGGSLTRSPTVNELLARTQGEGFFVFIIILCLPFVTPITVPGISTIIGAIIMFLAGRIALGLPPDLPRSIGRRALPSVRFSQIIRASVRLVHLLEKWIKPRGAEWIGWRPVRLGNATLIVWMAFLLAWPLPIWLTNTLPAYAIVFLAASMMEGDAYMIWAGYAVAAVTSAYFGLLVALACFFPAYYERVLLGLKAWL